MSAPLRVLVTGATGAVGQHLVDELLALPECELVLFVRDPSRLGPVAQHSRVEVVPWDLREPDRALARLRPVQRAVLAAAAWGPDAAALNVDATMRLATTLNAAGTEHLVWLGTASLLTSAGAARADASTLGTDYIRSKAVCRQALLAQWPTGLTIVHPTLVVAGGEGRRASHVGRLIAAIDERIRLAQWFTGDGSLHLVHAADLAGMVAQLLTRSPGTVPRELVAGGEPLTLAEALNLLLHRHGLPRYATVNLSPRRVEWLIRLLRVQLSPWDRLCLAERHFVYDGACLSLDGRRPRYPTAQDVLASIPLGR